MYLTQTVLVCIYRTENCNPSQQGQSCSPCWGDMTHTPKAQRNAQATPAHITEVEKSEAGLEKRGTWLRKQKLMVILFQ